MLSVALIVDAINEQSLHKATEKIIAIAFEQVQAHIKDLFDTLRKRGFGLDLQAVFVFSGAELPEKQRQNSIFLVCRMSRQPHLAMLPKTTKIHLTSFSLVL